MSFIQAAISVGSSDEISRFPAAVQGLRLFLNKDLTLVKGMSDPQYLDMLFYGKKSNFFLEPIAVGKLSSKKAAKLRKKMEEDAKVNMILSKLEHGGAWYD